MNIDTMDLIINIIIAVIGSGFMGYVAKHLHANHQLMAKHRDARKFADGMSHAQNLTSAFVAKFANDSSLAKGQRQEAVIRGVQGILSKHGYHVSLSLLIGMAEDAYQTYKAQGGKVVAPVPTPAPKAPVAQKAPVTDGNHLSDDEIDVLNRYREQKARN